MNPTQHYRHTECNVDWKKENQAQPNTNPKQITYTDNIITPNTTLIKTYGTLNPNTSPLSEAITKPNPNRYLAFAVLSFECL